ncbi:MAG: PIN domain-containing protein, partial [Salinisphaeraceae bacterium]|nr:PIN domain-containing protein [Salinisphaeraceae bacterium]
MTVSKLSVDKNADTPLSPQAQPQRIFVLDTNVLMHDPTALFRFEEHDIFLPMVVLEELDAGKKGLSETARNVRQVSRFLDEMLHDHSHAEIEQGLSLPSAPAYVDEAGEAQYGRLFFQTQPPNAHLPDLLPGNKPDNSILVTALDLKTKFPDRQVTLVSKDINLRIKAAAIGVHSEDYSNDKVLDDLDLLYTGYTMLDQDFWDSHGQDLDSWQEEGRTYYRVQGPQTQDWIRNEFLYFPQGDGPEFTVKDIDNEGAVLELVRDYREGKQSIWGIHARNQEQNFALNLLLDPEIDFVTLLGAAGTGKTLLALAAGLAQTLDDNRFREIIMTRVTVPVGEDIGFLPGTEEEKMTPWMGALMDN